MMFVLFRKLLLVQNLTLSPCLADGRAEVFGLWPLVGRGVSSL